MTATAVAPPRPARLLPRGGARMLLPPPAEPRGTPLALATGATHPILSRSVRSPITEQHWPTATPQASPEPDLGDPRQIGGAVVLAAVEALRGVRPLAQLVRWVSPEVFESLARAAGPATGARTRAVIRAQRVCRISPTVAEGSVVVHDGARVRAAAVRLEAHRGSWRATVLQIG